MGLAAIGIICCHTQANGVVMPGWLWQVFSLGQLGVSLFFFLSGFGLWYSLQNIKRGGVINWYIKRYKKLFIPFFILAIPCFAYSTILGGHNIWYFITRITTIEFWISGGGAWFVSVLLVLYLIAPWWERLLCVTKQRSLISWTAFFVILCFGDLMMTHSSEICFFFLGFWVAPYASKGISIPWFPLLLGSLALYVSFRLIPSLQSYPRSFFLVPLFIILPCLLFDLSWMKRINKIFSFMGKISLESYLCNVFLPAFFIHAAWVQRYHLWNNNIGYLLVVVVGIVLAYAVNRLSHHILDKTTKS